MIIYVKRVKFHFLPLSGLNNTPGDLYDVILIAFLEAEEHLLPNEFVIFTFLEVRFESDFEMIEGIFEIKVSHFDGFDNVFIGSWDLAASHVLI